MNFIKHSLASLALWMLKQSKYADERTKNMILTEAVKHLFNTVSADDILKENPDGTIRFEDKILTENYRKDLREQAKLLPELLLWKVLQADIKYQLNKKMFEEPLITQDVMWGKLLVFYNDVIQTRIKKLKL